MKRRILSIILTLAMVLSMLPITAWAEEPENTGLCPHHTEHTEECGYVPANKGAPCAYERTDDSYTVGMDSIHVHDEACGYAEPVGGEPCTYFCEICAGLADETEVSEGAGEPDFAADEVQALVDVLPTVEEVRAMDTDGQRTVYDQTQTAYDAYMALSEEQRGLITGAGVFEELFNFFNSQTAVTAIAGIAKGSGSESDPYQISSEAEFLALRAYVQEKDGNSRGEYFKLMNDISVGSVSNPGKKDTVCIGVYDSHFYGTFDGNGHTITVYIDDGSGDVGLFGMMEGTLKNLTIKGTVKFNQGYSGVFARHVKGTMENCHNYASYTSENWAHEKGGLVGILESGSIIKNCTNHGKIIAPGKIGGIVGQNKGTVENCHNYGDIEATTDRAGGIAAGGGTIILCSNSGKITNASRPTGGISGEGGTIKQCWNTGDVSSTYSGADQTFVGGIMGKSSGSLIENCYNEGNVTGVGYVGGILGYCDRSEGRISNCYNRGTITGNRFVSDIAGLSDGSSSNTFGKSQNYSTGEITYRLQGSQEEQIWYQKIGTDPYPLLTGDTSKIVRKVSFITNDNPDYYAIYANQNNTVSAGTFPAPPATDKFKFYGWALGSAAGSLVTTTLTVDSDKNLYAVGSQLYAGENGTIEVTTTYNTPVTVNLNDYMGYAGGATVTGHFTYSLATNTIGATISSNILTIPAGVNANEGSAAYSLSVTAKESSPAISPMSLGGYGSSDVTLKLNVRVNKATPTANVTAQQNLKYSGSALQLVTGTTTNGCTLEYRIDETGGWASGTPTASNAGDYKVYYRVRGNNNYSDLDENKYVTVKIAKAQSVVKTAPNPVTNLVYNAGAQDLIKEGAGDGGTIQYCVDSGNYSPAIPTKTNAGNYTVSYKVIGDSNHEDTAPQSFTVTIAKAEPAVIWPAVSKTVYVNDDPLKDSDLDGGSAKGVNNGELTGSFTLTNSSAKTWSNSGGKIIEVQFAPTDTINYQISINTGVVVNVIKRQMTDVTDPEAIIDKTYLTEQGSLGLPDTVQITASGNKKLDVPVTWSGYSAKTLNEQILTGKLIDTAEVENKSDLEAHITVRLQEIVLSVTFADKANTYTGAVIPHELPSPRPAARILRLAPVIVAS